MTITVVNAVSNIEVGRNFYAPANYDGVALPGGLADGDTVILFVRSANFQLNTPAGYTLLNTVTTASGGSTTVRLYVFKKDTVLATDSGTTLTVVATTSGNGSIWYSSVALRSSDGRFPVIDTQTVVTNNGSSLTVSMPSITATFASELILVAYSNTQYNNGTYLIPSGLTEITASGTRLATVFYQTRLKDQSTTADSLGFTGGGANVGAMAVIIRFDLLPLQGTLTDTIGATDAAPAAGWNLGTTATDTANMVEQALFGRQYPLSLADALAAADTDLRWVNPLFSLVDVSDSLSVAETLPAPTATYSMIDPVGNKKIFTNFRQIDPLYTDAFGAYTAWCNEASVSPTGTEWNFGTQYYNASFIYLGFSPILYGDADTIFIAAAGNIGLFRTQPNQSSTTGVSVMYGGVGWDANATYLYTPYYDTPTLTIGLVDNTYTYQHFSVFRLRRGYNYPTPKNEALIYLVTYSEKSGQPDQIGMAVRLRRGYIEIVTSPINTPLHAHQLAYVTGNYLLGGYTSGRNVKTTFSLGTTYHFLSNDNSGLIDVLSEGLNISGPSNTQIAQLLTTPVISNGLRIGEDYKTTLGAAMAQGMQLGDVGGLDVRYGGFLADALRLIDTHALQGKFATTQSDTIKLIDALIRVFPVDQAETIAVQDVAQTLLGVRVLEAMGLLDSPLPKATIYKTVAELLRVSDALRRFLSGVAVDAIGVAHTQTVKYNILRQLAETLGIADALSNKLMIRVDLAENVEVISSELLHTIFNGVIAEGVKISAAYLRPGDDVTTWVVNTMTGATTEYTNYNFNSFAQIGHKYLGASTAGLFELNGDDDAGTDIIAHLKGGFAQFNGSRYTGFKAAYLGMRGTGEFFFKLDAGDGSTYTYKIVAQDMQTTKVQLGKGLRARYFAYELISTGQDFDLDSIEFVPMIAQRRV